MFPRLRHRPVGRRHHQDRAIHLRRPGDHVLDVVGMPWAIDMRVMPVGGLVLHMRHRNRNPALALFGSIIDRIKRAKLHLGVVLRQHLGNRRRQRRLAVIDVPDRPDIHVRLAALEFFLRHCSFTPPLARNRSRTLPRPSLYLVTLPVALAITSSAIDPGASA